MLINIIKMPPVKTDHIDRRMTLTTRDGAIGLGNEPVVLLPQFPIRPERLLVGTLLDDDLEDLYKAIHVSSDSQYVFETVFSQTGPACTCLYTKVIGRVGSLLAISLPAIKSYQTERCNLLPVSDFIINANRVFSGGEHFPFAEEDLPMNMIVPPVFGAGSIRQYLYRLRDILHMEYGLDGIGTQFKPIYDHVPTVLEALVKGFFHRSPFYEIRGYHPSIQIEQDRWSSYHEMTYGAQTFHRNIVMYHPAFDNVVVYLMTLRQTKFSVTSLMTHALDGYSSCWMTRAYRDPYRSLFIYPQQDDKTSQDALSQMFHQAAKIYCEIQGISPEMFLEKDKDVSSVTITKTLNDEISFTFHDLVTDQYTTYYTAFPALALTTQSVGWFV